MSREPTQPIDLEIGRRLRARRKALGMTQTEVGTRIGITFQQVQKYEKGQNRLSVAMLRHFAGALRMPAVDLMGEVLAPTPSLHDQMRDRITRAMEANVMRPLMADDDMRAVRDALESWHEPLDQALAKATPAQLCTARAIVEPYLTKLAAIEERMSLRAGGFTND